MGYMRRPTPEHKLASRGAKCILLGMSPNHPHSTFRVRDLTTGAIVLRQAVTWHPAATARGGAPVAAKSGGGYTRHSPQLKTATGYTPTPRLGYLETVAEEPGEESIPQEPQDIPLEDK